MADLKNITLGKKPKIISGQYPVADLMPKSRLEAIDLRQTKRKWRKAVIYTFAACLIASVGVIGLRVYTQFNYDSAVSSQDSINSEIAGYAEVDQALTIQNEITALQQQGATAEISWSSLLNRIQGQLPAGSSLSGFTVTVGGTSPDAPTAAIITKVSSPAPISYSEVLSAFNGLEGVSDVQIGNLVSTAGNSETAASYLYPVAFSFDESILTNKYNPQEEAE